MDEARFQLCFGEAVRARRQAIGLSQEALAGQVSVHRTYMGSVERGERNISLQNILRIAGALRVPVSELMRDVESRVRAGPQESDDA